MIKNVGDLVTLSVAGYPPGSKITNVVYTAPVVFQATAAPNVFKCIAGATGAKIRVDAKDANGNPISGLSVDIDIIGPVATTVDVSAV